MLTIELSKKSKVPLYEQLYSYIKDEIIAGHIAYASKLPSKRNLEKFLNISQTTVETAYEQLVAEGYIESKPRKGYYVIAKEKLISHLSMPDVKLTKKSLKLKQTYKYDFYPGNIDNSVFPFKKWRKLYNDAISEDNKDLLLLGDPNGEIELRKEIQSYLYASRGVVCQPEQIIIGAGVEQLLSRLIFLLGNKAIYGLENPGYPFTRHILNSHKKHSTYIDVDSEGAKISQLKHSKINVMYVTPSHQFPYGSVLSANRRAQLLNWASSKDNRYIIEDDYDSEFRYSGRTIPSLHSLGKGKTVIYLSTFSKCLMPSHRIGYMVLPIPLIKRYTKEFTHYASCVSRIDQYVLANFMKLGYFEKHLNRMRTVYRKKLDIVKSVLREYRDVIHISGEKAGLHILLSFSKKISENKLIEKAQKIGARVCGLSLFFHKDASIKRSGIVLGFAGIEEDKIKPILIKLIKCWLK